MQNLNRHQNVGRVILSKKSWTAYVFLIIILLILLIILFSSNFTLLVIPILFIIYKILMLRSLVLYMDEDGVWEYSGIFPWNSGFRGVKWIDLDEAVFYTGLKSWALKSYTIKISHRFTQNSEITLTHMVTGDIAVQLINERHFAMINI